MNGTQLAQELHQELLKDQEPILTGKALREAIDKALDERTPLIEGFCYERNTIQIFADDGIGKSMAILNAVLQASAGRKVWNALEVPKPLRIVWLCAERPLDEPLERIKLMEKHCQPNLDNLVFDKEIQNYDLKDREGQSRMLMRISELLTAWSDYKCDLIVIDPIYAVVSGGLNGDAEVHLVNKFIRSIQNRHDCAVIYMHHTNRGVKKEGSSGRYEGDMYGSRFLSANLTGQYHLKKTEEGVELCCSKNTYGNLMQHIPLVYDELSQTLSMSGETGEFNKRDKIMMFLRQKHKEQREFVLREISNQLKVSDAYIRKVINPLVRTGHIINKSSVGTKGVYVVEKIL